VEEEASVTKERKINQLEQEVQRLTLLARTMEVDRDYYRSQRDRWKAEFEALRSTLDMARSEA